MKNICSFQVYNNFLETSQWTVSCKTVFPGKKLSPTVFHTEKRGGGESYDVKKTQTKKPPRVFKGETLPVSCQDDNGKNEIDILTQIIC